MAVSNTGSGGTFYSVALGKFRKKVEEGTEGAEERVNKKGNTVHELCYDKMEGLITRVEFKESPFGQALNVFLDDGDILSLFLESKAGDVFMKVLPNIDESIPTQFSTWIDKEGKAAFCVLQNAQPLTWAFTRETPNGMPAATKTKKAGKDVWNFDAVVNFLYENTLKEAKRFNGEVTSTGDEVATAADISEFGDEPAKKKDKEF